MKGTTVYDPGNLGLSYSEWRASQRQALEILGGHESGLLALQAPTGSGKSGIGLGWAMTQARDTYDPAEPMSARRTLILTQRNVELTQYEGLLPTGDYTDWAASLRGRARYHCPYLASGLAQLSWPDKPERECQSDHDYCDLADCPWPRFEDDAPCVGMADPERDCPFYSVCPYFEARKRARRASVVVTNYAYGVEALAYPRIAGVFDNLVADEAHDLLSILTDLASYSLNLAELDENLQECLQEDYQTLWEQSQPRGEFSGLALDSRLQEAQEGLRTRINVCRGEITRMVDIARRMWGQPQYGARFLPKAVSFSRDWGRLVLELLAVFPTDKPNELFEQLGLSAKGMRSLKRHLNARGRELQKLQELGDLGEEFRSNYVLGNDAGPKRWEFAPVDLRVGSLGKKVLWSKVQRSLAMSGTLPPGQALDYFLGVDERPRVETLAPEFLPEQRPVRVWTRKLDLRYATGYQDRAMLFDAVSKLLASPRLQAVKGMVLWSSYKWMNDYLGAAQPEQTVFCHGDARQMAERLRAFRDFAGPAVFMSPTAIRPSTCRMMTVAISSSRGPSGRWFRKAAWTGIAASGFLTIWKTWPG